MRAFSIKTPAIHLLLLTALASGAAGAQQPAAVPQAQAATAAPKGVEPGALRDAALQIASAVDAGQAAQIWKDASAVVKRTVTDDEFVAGTKKLRQPLGALVGRDWISIRRMAGDGKEVPAGLYGSVEFVTTFAGNRVVRELVTFRLDEDSVWRLSGYTVQP